MLNTLKKKFSLIYGTLVLIIVIVGSVSAINVYKLGKAIDGLITNNYKSIDAINKMNKAIEEQDKAILKYVQGKREESIDSFYKSNEEFYKWFYAEKNNVTEVGERELVEEINNKYRDFNKMFLQLTENSKIQSEIELSNYYINSITPVLIELKNDFQEISDLNEKIMFEKKTSVKDSAEESTFYIVILSTLAVILGCLISIVFTNRYFNPIHLLIEAIRSVKEGELNKQAPVIYNDEIGILAIEFNNMTSRLYEFEKSTKGSLIKEKNRSLSIVKSISDPIIVLDASFKIKLVNNEWENFFGVAEENIVNRHFLEIIKKVEIYDYVFDVINNDLKDSGKLIDISNNNQSCFFNITATAIRGACEKIDGVVVLFKNVTELKQLEMVKTDFIGTISHEFKTPLTSIMMGVGLISGMGSINEKQKVIIDTIKEDAQQLNVLVSNLLKISQIESNRAIFEIKESNITQLVESSALTFINKAKEKNLNFEYNIEDNLPSVMIDEEKIRWVINNLISNAIRYTEKGKITLAIELRNRKIHISVEDTGRGIPKEYEEKIFEKFVRVQEFETVKESTGLGLAIAKEIVEAHRGEIWCESKVGIGSVFTFTIPIEIEEV